MSHMVLMNLGTLPNCEAGTDNVGLAFAEYLKFRNTEQDFKKYLENKSNVNKLKESVKKDAK